MRDKLLTALKNKILSYNYIFFLFNKNLLAPLHNKFLLEAYNFYELLRKKRVAYHASCWSHDDFSSFETGSLLSSLTSGKIYFVRQKVSKIFFRPTFAERWTSQSIVFWASFVGS